MRVIKKITDAIKRIQKKNQQKKYNYVFELGYRYFYDIQETQTDSGINIPDFLVADDLNRKCKAHYLTSIQMKKIMDNNALNYCYKSAKKYAKQHKLLAQGL